MRASPGGYLHPVPDPSGSGRVDMLTTPVAAAWAAVTTGAWVKSKLDMYLTRGCVGAWTFFLSIRRGIKKKKRWHAIFYAKDNARNTTLIPNRQGQHTNSYTKRNTWYQVPLLFVKIWSMSTFVEPHSRFGDKLLGIRATLSPKRECGSNLYCGMVPYYTDL